MKKISSIFSLLIFAMLLSSPCVAIENPEKELPKVGLDTKLGSQVDLGLSFTDSTGQLKTLKEILDPRKPIVLIPAYYTCPRLCGLLLNGATRLFNELNLIMGKEFQVVTISFNDNEKYPLAAQKEADFRTLLTKNDADKSAWHFLVGDKENIAPLMTQIGFKYFKDKEEYAHTAVIVILTPEGEISQYFTGIDFSPWDTRLALIEASQGKMGSLIDHILLYCFRYDHSEGKYTWAVFNLLRVGGLLSILGVLAVVFWSSKTAKH